MCYFLIKCIKCFQIGIIRSSFYISTLQSETSFTANFQCSPSGVSLFLCGSNISQSYYVQNKSSVNSYVTQHFNETYFHFHTIDFHKLCYYMTSIHEVSGSIQWRFSGGTLRDYSLLDPIWRLSSADRFIVDIKKAIRMLGGADHRGFVYSLVYLLTLVLLNVRQTLFVWSLNFFIYFSHRLLLRVFSLMPTCKFRIFSYRFIPLGSIQILYQMI